MYKKFKTGILVRDKMIARMRRDKIRVDYKQLNQEDYIASLRNKIIEEANEVAEEKDINKLVYELADILEVIQALSSVVGIKKAEIINAQKEKREISGSFKKKYFTNFVEIDTDNPVINYYLSRAKKYPEILS